MGRGHDHEVISIIRIYMQFDHNKILHCLDCCLLEYVPVHSRSFHSAVALAKDELLRKAAAFNVVTLTVHNIENHI